jgi:DNA polymerase I-like protein with 3'-5' exonuclease and polymerase domains
VNYTAIDIETAPHPLYKEFPDAALDHNRSIITVVAVSGVSSGKCYREPSQFSNHPVDGYVGHGAKFDFKSLIRHGWLPDVSLYTNDSLLMAVALAHKIPDSWLADYDAARKQLNQLIGKDVHRRAGKYSLKTLGPYFLPHVQPFWEVADHNDDAYVLTDADVTRQLAYRLERELKERGGWEFYREKLMPWSRMLTKAETRGVKLDFDLLSRFEGEYGEKALNSERKLRDIWAAPFKAYEEKQRQEITAEREAMKGRALMKLAPSKLKNAAKAALENAEKIRNTCARYDEGRDAALAKVEPLNLGSPTQLKWLLKEQLGLDIQTFDEEDESTGKAVLERLAGQGEAGVTELLEWRQASKLTTAFFPSYREKAYQGVLHASFNMNGTRTGRLSSSNPNLQQISKKILGLFQARPGYVFVYRDVSAIEPRLIAYATECPKLCSIFISGTDFHSENVRTMLGIEETDAVIKAKYGKERDLVKEVGLALMYGAGAGRIEECAAKRGFRWTYKECKEKYNRFKQEYEAVWRYKASLEDRIRSGELIENLLGRPLTFDPERLHMQSLNTYIQSGGSDVLLESVNQTCDKAATLGLEVHPLLYIHDSVTIETPVEQGQRVYDLLGERIAAWELQTTYGLIPMKSEGRLCERLGDL